MNAHALQEDIESSKLVADEIAHEAEVGDALHRTVKDNSDHVEFLEKEVEYNTQLKEALSGIQAVQKMLDEAESAGAEGRLLDSLNILSSMSLLAHCHGFGLTYLRIMGENGGYPCT
jgi:centromere/kinetochore protein ZW10